MKIKIEYLCPEFCHFYGDHANLTYISARAELMGNKVEVVKTIQSQTPLFAENQCLMLYISPTNDVYQKPLIKYLSKYKKELQTYIDNGGIVLATGNSKELFGKFITDFDGNNIEALDMFDISSTRFRGKRHSYNVLAKYNQNINIAGYKNLASSCDETKNKYPLFDIIKEKGEQTSTKEGIHYKNFFATHLLGPVLLQNPLFADEILKLLFKEDFKKIYLPYELLAHEKRFDEILNCTNADKNG